MNASIRAVPSVRLKLALLSALITLLAILLSGCATAYPNPHNPAYSKVGSLYYCYGPQQIVKPGTSYVDDACRIDSCAMHVPEQECLPLLILEETP